jgi:hypothetical protein
VPSSSTPRSATASPRTWARQDSNLDLTDHETESAARVPLCKVKSGALRCAQFLVPTASSVPVWVSTSIVKAGREPRRVVVSWDVVEVAHRHLDVRVPHPRLDLAQIDALRGALRAKRVAQIVEDDRVVAHDALRVRLARWRDEPQVAQPRAPKRGVELVPDHVVIDVSADLIAEGEIVRSSEVRSSAQRLERDERLIGDRHAPAAMALRGVLLAFDVVALHVEDPVRKVDVPPTQSHQLAHSEPGERRNEEQRPKQLGGRLARDRVDLLHAQHVEVV